MVTLEESLIFDSEVKILMRGRTKSSHIKIEAKEKTRSCPEW